MIFRVFMWIFYLNKGASVFGVLASATFNLGNLGSLAAMTTAIGTCIDLEI